MIGIRSKSEGNDQVGIEKVTKLIAKLRNGLVVGKSCF